MILTLSPFGPLTPFSPEKPLVPYEENYYYIIIQRIVIIGKEEWKSLKFYLWPYNYEFFLGGNLKGKHYDELLWWYLSKFQRIQSNINLQDLL